MPDFERRTTVALDADSAFDRLAEPAQLPFWLVGITLDDSIAVEGDPSLQEEGEAKATAPAAEFLADRKARTVHWTAPSGEYSGELEVQPMLASMSTVIVRIHTAGAVDPKAAEGALDAVVKGLARHLAS